MKQQSNIRTARKYKPFVTLLMSWLIILGVYLLLRLIFIIFGFHLSPALLGGCLAIIPYLAGAIYLWKSKMPYKNGFYALGILIPSIAEKIILYFSGASLYGISPSNITGVLEKIALNEPYVKIFTHPAARYILNLSFLGWSYVLSSLLFCGVLVLCLAGHSRKSICKS